MPSQIHENGWLSVDISDAWEYKARAMRAERDQRYGNIYPEVETDARWVGELGELTFRSWLNHRGYRDYEWIQDDAAGKPDFVLGNGAAVGIKTVKRKVAPRSDFTMQITAQHAHEPAQHFFFLSYEFQRKTMWMLGGISKELFLQTAQFYSDGEWVHPNYQVRGHNIYNAQISCLVPPNEWLAQTLGPESPAS